jgi:hypothetical protein
MRDYQARGSDLLSSLTDRTPALPIPQHTYRRQNASHRQRERSGTTTVMAKPTVKGFTADSRSVCVRMSGAPWRALLALLVRSLSFILFDPALNSFSGRILTSHKSVRLPGGWVRNRRAPLSWTLGSRPSRRSTVVSISIASSASALIIYFEILKCLLKF